ncbi:MAG: hypothetical protein U9Q76_08515 [candidate division WOR-3 bacterium]|nr:hypothetical protein [candidate division WOR-3 bacterium]
MPFQILNVLLISLGCIVPLILLTFVWAFHWFPYPAKDKTVEGRVQEMRRAGFRKLVTDFPYYTRASGVKGEHNAMIARGLWISSVVHIGSIILSAVILFLISLIIGRATEILYYIYSGILFLLSVFIFPDLFVRFSHLTGKWTDFFTQGDLPATAAYWGGILSLYASAIVIRDFSAVSPLSSIDPDMLVNIFSSTVGAASIYAVPFVLFGLIVGVTAGRLPNIRYQNWVYFLVSWMVGLVGTEILAFILVLGSKPT